MPELTQARVRELFDYDPASGALVRKITVSHNAKAGTPATTKAWNNYLVIRVDGRLYRVHHIIWLMVYGYLPKELDHINGDRSDNRGANLREASRQENMKNRCMLSNNTSGYMGVFWAKHINKWRVMVGKKHIGVYSNKEDAIKARATANREYGYHPNHGRAG